MLPLFIMFGLLFSLQCNFPAFSATNGSALMTDQVLISGDKLISSNSKFALGFFRIGRSKSSDNTTLLNWYLGYGLTRSQSSQLDKPITDPIFKVSKVIVSRDGNIVILNNVTKSMIWSSQIENRQNTSRNTNASNPSNVWWQSFDHPTDVLLPGAKLGRNKVTGQKYSLISKKNSEDPAPGLYCMELDPSGSKQFNAKVCNSSMVYFSTEQ
uniref:non-specific serine/threonine protein kinase n=1 Tax=Leersia perrieri TaxID=77586 RepID=A0A0D9W2U1_9ORYZ